MSLPRRPDRRRDRGNGTGAQRRRHRGRRGQLETIVERRAQELELRKSGWPYREIGQLLGVDVHTVHADIAAELAALREQTVEHAHELRTLELQRLDYMTEGLWSRVGDGDPPAVCAAIRVSERRARLMGLDAPVASTTELTGRLSVETEAKYKAEREALLLLSAEELQDLADASQQLMANALARAEARRMTVTVAALPPAQNIIDAECKTTPVASESADPPPERETTAQQPPISEGETTAE